MINTHPNPRVGRWIETAVLREAILPGEESQVQFLATSDNATGEPEASRLTVNASFPSDDKT